MWKNIVLHVKTKEECPIAVNLICTKRKKVYLAALSTMKEESTMAATTVKW